LKSSMMFVSLLVPSINAKHLIIVVLDNA
jgi:hypothetical protein